MQHSRAVLAPSGEDDLAPEMMRHLHQSITNSEHRNAYRKDFRINLGRAFVVNAGRATGKNDSIWIKIFDLSGGKIERNYFGIDLKLANAARNDLGVLRSEIENENL